MNLTITVLGPDLDETELNEFNRDLLNTLKELNTSAAFSELPRPPGSKGDTVAAGTIILSLIGSGGVAVSLISILKAYIDRERNIKIRIEDARGNRVEMEAANLTASQLRSTTNLLKELLGELDV